MELYQRIVAERKRKGLTQEQLAEAANVTVRTIQRIESGESMPRAYTLKTIATALNIEFELLAPGPGGDGVVVKDPTETPRVADDAEGKHFLQVLCLSCFTYLIIPILHFLLPAWLLKTTDVQNPRIRAFARKLVRVQMYWMAGLFFLLLLTLAYNLSRAAWFQKTNLLNYLWPFFGMYLLNAVIITRYLIRINSANFPAINQPTN